MNRKLVIEFEIDAEDKTCGKCTYLNSWDNPICNYFREVLKGGPSNIADAHLPERCQKCLEAEAHFWKFRGIQK
jgi:hypothetical protein